MVVFAQRLFSHLSVDVLGQAPLGEQVAMVFMISVEAGTQATLYVVVLGWVGSVTAARELLRWA